MAELGFILRKGVMNACETLNDQDFRKTITGLFDYTTKGTYPEFEGIPKVIFEMEKSFIDSNNEKWRIRNTQVQKPKKTKNKAENNDDNYFPF